MTTDPLTVTVVLPEQPDHGVVRHARRLASSLGELDAIEVELVHVPCGRGAVDAARRTWERASRRDVVHLHLTDRLYGADADEAALVLAELLDASARAEDRHAARRAGSRRRMRTVRTTWPTVSRGRRSGRGGRREQRARTATGGAARDHM